MFCYSASRTMMCTKSPAEGRRSPFLLSRGTCLYPVWEHKEGAVRDHKQKYQEVFVLRVNWALCARWKRGQFHSVHLLSVKTKNWLESGFTWFGCSELQRSTHPFSSCWMGVCTVLWTHCQTWSRSPRQRSAPAPGPARTRRTESFHSTPGWNLQQIWWVIFFMRTTFNFTLSDSWWQSEIMFTFLKTYLLHISDQTLVWRSCSSNFECSSVGLNTGSVVWLIDIRWDNVWMICYDWFLRFCPDMQVCAPFKTMSEKRDQWV